MAQARVEMRHDWSETFTRRRQIALALFVVWGVGICAHTWRHRLPVGIFLNITSSLEQGLYLGARTDTLRRGDLVLLTPPTSALGWGCVAPGQKLLKQLVALQGDEVCLQQGRLFVAGTFYASTATHGVTGKPMPPAHFSGCMRVPPGHVFVATPHRQGCDSRFFGPQPREAIWGRAFGPLLRMRSPPTPG